MTRFDATDRRPVDKWTAAPRPTTSPQGQKPQQKRSTHMVHKPVNSECSRQGYTFGVAQIAVIKQPKPKFMLLFRFVKSCQIGVAVAQKARQKTDTEPFFQRRKRKRGFVDVKLVFGLGPGLPGPGSVILAAINPNPFFRSLPGFDRRAVIARPIDGRSHSCQARADQGFQRFVGLPDGDVGFTFQTV